MVAATGVTIEIAPNSQAKEFIVVLDNTTDTNNTYAMTLSELGIKEFVWIGGCVHTTESSVVVTEAPTTAVSAGVLTITVGGSAVTDKKRAYLVIGR